MVAAGGTGGHLFPAFSLAEELGRRGFAIDLVTDMRGDRYGTGFPARRIHPLPAATLTGRSPLKMAATLTTLARGFFKARKLLTNVKPLAVCGFGGYPTVAPILAATQKDIPTLIHEQNAVMGRANRMLSRRVSAIALSFPDTKYVTEAAAKTAHLVGNPVRDMVAARREQAYPLLSSGGPFNLLIFGGSQGARYFSDTLPGALLLLPDEIRSRLHVTQQCREEDLARVGDAYKQAGIEAHLATFFKELPQIMANSHLIIARAGASTVGELCVLGRPAILVPLPHALDNDQLLNAQRLERAGAGWCMEQKTADPQAFADKIGELVRRPELLRNAAEAAKRTGRPDAVARLADLVEQLAAR